MASVDAKKLVVAVAGIVLVYSGLKGKGLSTTFKDLLTGKNPQSDPQATPIGGVGTNWGSVASAGSAAAARGIIGSASPGDTSAHSQTAVQNQQLAQRLIPKSWRTGQQWQDLLSLWNQESGWSNTAENASGAYGIAQALPNTKYPLAARPPSEGGQANPTAQILWGIAYIKSRYGNPSNAWAHELANSWY